MSKPFTCETNDSEYCAEQMNRPPKKSRLPTTNCFPRMARPRVSELRDELTDCNIGDICWENAAPVCLIGMPRIKCPAPYDREASWCFVACPEPPEYEFVQHYEFIPTLVTLANSTAKVRAWERVV